MVDRARRVVVIGTVYTSSYQAAPLTRAPKFPWGVELGEQVQTVGNQPFLKLRSPSSPLGLKAGPLEDPSSPRGVYLTVLSQRTLRSGFPY